MLKIIQAIPQQYMNQELPAIQAGFRKGRGTRDQIASICWIIEKSRKFQENIICCFTDCIEPLAVWIITNCGKHLKRWEYQTILPVSWETYMRVKKQQLEPYMKKLTGSQLRKEYAKAVYHHSVYLIYMLSTSCKMPSWKSY